MAKKNKTATISVSVNLDNQVSFKGTIDKNFKLNNDRKRIYVYDNQSNERILTVNIKPYKNEVGYHIEITEDKTNSIVHIQNMKTKLGDIKLIGLHSDYNDLKTSTIIIEKS